MTISIWRYSHLALAVSSVVFILLASITGAILAFQPISEQMAPYKVADLDEVSLAQTVEVFKETYPEVIEIKVDASHFVMASVFTEEGDNLEGYFNPITAEFLGQKSEPSKFFQWVTNFHRSLFLKSVGRFFVGLCSFLLFVIAITGTILIVKRQRGIQQFFAKIVNENFSQYWHVVLGRLSLVPIIIITLTGVYLSMEKFNLLPEGKEKYKIDFNTISETPKRDVSEFQLFQNTPLSEVETLEFPFSDDVEDYFTLKLKQEELVVNQYTGEVLSSLKAPMVEVVSNFSMALHTGKGNTVWAFILGLASINILFFIYSGFDMTLKRRASGLKNKYRREECQYIILVGSENGSTMHYANAFYKQLLEVGEKVFIAELNDYTEFSQAEQFIIFTATYGQGEAPTNANKFLEGLKQIKQSNKCRYAVVGFGSLAYPDFCQFAFDVDKSMEQHFERTMEVTAIHDKSLEAFHQFVGSWSSKVGLKLEIPKEELTQPQKHTKTLKVVGKTEVADSPDNTFLIKLKPKKTQQFSSGDLLAIYPKNDYRERLYSIGKVDGNIQLSIKFYEHGLGSNYLNDLEVGDKFKAKIIKNSSFHFPVKAPKVILIANGTGVAPFLGMLHQNKKHRETKLYLGLRTQASFNLYKPEIEALLIEKKLSDFELVLSREADQCYVQDKLHDNASEIAQTLYSGGVIMICGSLAMQKGVLGVLESICVEFTHKPLSFYQAQGQLKMDCY
ncbi:PepSY domain-containing protein [Mangrovimonas sp. DI 80]|uniref:PepSY domain-containing protein n=1 Tax=Mangrovimonas sp. DI 80 TaxID=1779330 RepID=UPI000976BC4A|nr:PepSY domain-containing protein [Mangrovimonas sp. DI 80]OMP32053.1 FAD-binding oxidoreductase [Mangrovimonas sp. DI 80]